MIRINTRTATGLGLLALCFMLSSCVFAPRLDYEFLGRYSKGTPRERVQREAVVAPEHTINFADSSIVGSIQVDLYRMIVSSTNSNRFPESLFDRVRYSYIAFAFVDERLVFCGTPDDFTKNTRADINQIGNRINSYLQESR